MRMATCMSLNVRVDVPSDGENRFFARSGRLLDFLVSSSADILMLQEVTPRMADVLSKGLPGYHMVIAYRNGDDEGVPVLFRKDMFALLFHKTFWLSKTPDVPSKDPDSHFHRIATIVVLESVQGRRTVVANVHLDYASDEVAARQATALLSGLGTVLEDHPGADVIIAGDFNQTPGSVTIGIMEAAYRRATDGVTPTFHGFGKSLPGDVIDHMFTNSDTVTNVRVTRPGPPWISDHHPIEAELG
jgi:endonuclease/exonuclease/phosphatase family metal-dependent hydrolase